jgi:alpha-L-rhamnosidase
VTGDLGIVRGGDDAPIRVVGLRVEHLVADPALGVSTATPRLSWRTETDRRDWFQAAWELEATDGGGRTWWRSGRREGGDSVLVPWGGEPLASRAIVDWRVRVWGTDGSTSGWSDSARFEIGLLDPADWVAVAVGADWLRPGSTDQPATQLRRTFSLGGDVVRARVHVTALGVYELAINGRRVGDHVLAPGWTSYRHRLSVQTFDVTELLASGVNTMDATVADGWWRGYVGHLGERELYGDRTALIAQLEVDTEGGDSVTVATDQRWEAAPGPVRQADLYNGETYDAGVTAGPWTSVVEVPFDAEVLHPQIDPPVRVVEVVRPVSIERSPTGRIIVDFGQNLVGVVRFRVTGEPGTQIVIRHAEVLEDGELCTRLLRAAEATDRYTVAGTGEEEWHPRFTFHGFRYADVQGWPGELTEDDLEALVIHSDLTRIGWFECSNPLVNRLHENIVWGWRGNSLSIPTDCPQRDERLGWTGDIQVFARTAAFLTDTAAFLDSWLADLASDQLADGRVTPVVPDALGDQLPIYGAGWGDAATVVPSTLHEWFGDAGVLARQMPSMIGWLDSIELRAGSSRRWVTDLQWGDWVDPTVDPSLPWASRTDRGFLATAWFAHSSDLVADAARALGDDDVAERYSTLASEIRAGIAEQWVAPSGRVVADTQTGCATALQFGLVPDRARPVVGSRLVELVRDEGHRVATGFLGTPLLLPALTAAGAIDDAYRLLLQTEAPSWLYAVVHGATTIWERWAAIAPDGTLNGGEDMLSFNHYAFGAVGEWLHGTVGGLMPLEPGLRRFRVAPQPGPGIDAAEVVHDGPYGRIEIGWVIEDGRCTLRVVVPPNSTAEVHPPGGGGVRLDCGSGTHELVHDFGDHRVGET